MFDFSNRNYRAHAIHSVTSRSQPLKPVTLFLLQNHAKQKLACAISRSIPRNPNPTHTAVTLPHTARNPPPAKPLAHTQLKWVHLCIPFLLPNLRRSNLICATFVTRSLLIKLPWIVFETCHIATDDTLVTYDTHALSCIKNHEQTRKPCICIV